jgi:hypothetical protein
MAIPRSPSTGEPKRICTCGDDRIEAVDPQSSADRFVDNDETFTNMGSRKKSTARDSKPLPAAISKGYERYLKIVLSLPGAEASTSYRTPSVKVGGKIMSRWRTEAEGGLAIRCDFLDRQILLQAQPEVFFLTDHYRDYPMILVRLERISRDALADVVERAWRLVAPAKLLKERDAASAPASAANTERVQGGHRRR